MKPWMPVAAVVLVFLAFAARSFWFRARSSGPFPFSGGDPGKALASLLRISAGARIDIVGGSFAYVAASSAWRNLLTAAVRRGAAVRYIATDRHAGGEGALRTIAGLGRGSLSAYAIADAPRIADLAADVREFHFLICESPAQLWLEGAHEPGAVVARDCEFVPDAAQDERWSARREDFEALLQHAAKVELSSQGEAAGRQA